MGCCYSYLEKQNQKKLKLLETLNKTIDNLRLLQNEESRKQENLRLEKLELEQDINLEKQKLLESFSINDKIKTLEDIISFYLHEVNFNNQTIQ